MCVCVCVCSVCVHTRAISGLGTRINTAEVQTTVLFNTHNRRQKDFTALIYLISFR